MKDLSALKVDSRVLFAMRQIKAAKGRIAAMGDELTDLEKITYDAIETVMGEFLLGASGLFEGKIESIDDLYRKNIGESAFGGPIDSMRRGRKYVSGKDDEPGQYEPVRLDFKHGDDLIPMHDNFVIVLNDLIATRRNVDAGSTYEHAGLDKGYIFARQLGLDMRGFELSEALGTWVEQNGDEPIIIPSTPDAFVEEVGAPFAETLSALQKIHYDATVYEPDADNHSEASSSADLMRFGLQAFTEVQKRLADGHSMPPARLRMAMLAGDVETSLVEGLNQQDSPVTKAIAAIAAQPPEKATRMLSLAHQILGTGYAI